MNIFMKVTTSFHWGPLNLTPDTGCYLAMKWAIFLRLWYLFFGQSYFVSCNCIWRCAGDNEKWGKSFWMIMTKGPSKKISKSQNQVNCRLYCEFNFFPSYCENWKKIMTVSVTIWICGSESFERGNFLSQITNIIGTPISIVSVVQLSQ